MKQLSAICIRILCMMIVAVCLFEPAAAATKRRLAMVIGNSTYLNIGTLPNPVRDAAGMAESLLSLHFEVYKGIDLDRSQFVSLVAEFKSALKSGDVEAVVFYYAGHGFQLSGENHLVPTDANLSDRALIAEQTIVLNSIINDISAPTHQTIILLDACRNNPLPPGTEDEGTDQGLAEVDSGSGTFIAFATEPNKVAKDGFGTNSPFAAALLRHLDTPRLSISDMMISVRNEVTGATANEQIPADFSKLRAQFYFNPTNAKPLVTVAANWQKLALATSSATTRSIGSAIETAKPNPDNEWQVASIDPQVLPLPPINIPEVQTGSPDKVEVMSPEQQLAFVIQKDLLRLRCGTAKADGEWGKQTIRGLERVSKKTGIGFQSEGPAETTLIALQSLTGPLCTPECKKGERVSKKGACVAVAVKTTTTTAVEKPDKSTKPGKKGTKPAKRETSVGGGIGVGSFF